MPTKVRTIAAHAASTVALVALLCAEPAHSQHRDAEWLRSGTMVVDSISQGGQRVYHVDAPVGSRLRLSVPVATTNFNLRIVDAAGRVVREEWVARGHAARIRFFVEEATPFEVRVRSLAAEYPEFAGEFPAGSYELRLDALPSEDAKREAARLEAALSWLRSTLQPLASLSAGSGYGDVLHLEDVLRDVRVVGLGEATHGTREFFQVKHRLIEYLVSDLGFTVIGLEMDEGEARTINEYIAGGAGTASGVVAQQGMWQWDTEEVVELVGWLRQWNERASPPRRVRFVGFDFQVNAQSRMDVLDFLARVAPDRVEAVDSLLHSLVLTRDAEGNRRVAFYGYDTDRKARIATAVDALLGYFVRNEALFSRATSAAEYRRARDAAARFAQFTHTHSNPTFEPDQIGSGVAIRSRYLAENVIRILEQEGSDARIVVWAHNQHLRADPYRAGYFLRERLGQRYYGVGMSFHRGGFRALELSRAAPRLTDTRVGPALQESVGWALHRAGRGNAFLDLRRAPPTGPVADWLAEPRSMRSVGNGYIVWNPSGYLAPGVVLGHAFDGIVFIEETTPARANTSGR